MWRDGVAPPNNRFALAMGRAARGSSAKALSLISGTTTTLHTSWNTHLTQMTNSVWVKTWINPDDHLNVGGVLAVAGYYSDPVQPVHLARFWWEEPGTTKGIAVPDLDISEVTDETQTGFDMVGDKGWLFISGAYGRRIFRTTDGGVKWWGQIPSTDVVMLSAFDAQHLMAEGLKSSDGGLTWQADGLPADAGAFVPEKRALSAAVWVASSSTGDIKLTKNFGVDWTLIESLTSNPYILRTTRG